MPQDAATAPFADWPQGLREEMDNSRENGIVGSVLVSETDRVRVWHLEIPAGKRCTFHRHVLDYFWTCHSHGVARGYFEDGRIADTTHFPGDTRHLNFGPGESMIHSVENIGDTHLLFTTVEFLDSPNAPLPIPDEVRLKLPA
jgi:beta-alanine degradation protein BauB